MKSPIIRGILIPSSYEKHNNGGENAAKELAENIFSQAELAEGYRRGLCVHRQPRPAAGKAADRKRLPVGQTLGGTAYAACHFNKGHYGASDGVGQGREKDTRKSAYHRKKHYRSANKRSGGASLAKS